MEKTARRHTDKLAKKSSAHRVYELSQKGMFTVKSGSSGKKYQVAVQKDGTATCTCDWGVRRPGFDRRTVCSHVMAVYRKKIKANGYEVTALPSRKEAKKQPGRKFYAGDGVWFVRTKKQLEGRH